MKSMWLMALTVVAWTAAAQGPGRGAGGQGPQSGVQGAQAQQMPHMPMHDPQQIQQMQQMQAQVAEMRALMAQMHDVKDPAERQKLMREHVLSMQHGMSMLGHMMTPGAGPGQGTRCADDDAQCRMREMQNHSMMLEQRMTWMQQMMEQMMSQIQAQQDEAAPKGKN